MVPIIEAVRAYATMGEICKALKDVFGEYVDTGADRLDERRSDEHGPKRSIETRDVDVGLEGDLAREPPVVDLHLLVDAPRAPRPPALPGEDEGPLVGEDLDLRRVDPGQLGDDVDRRAGSATPRCGRRRL